MLMCFWGVIITAIFKAHPSPGKLSEKQNQVVISAFSQSLKMSVSHSVIRNGNGKYIIFQCCQWPASVTTGSDNLPKLTQKVWRVATAIEWIKIRRDRDRGREGERGSQFPSRSTTKKTAWTGGSAADWAPWSVLGHCVTSFVLVALSARCKQEPTRSAKPASGLPDPAWPITHHHHLRPPPPLSEGWRSEGKLGAREEEIAGSGETENPDPSWLNNSTGFSRKKQGSAQYMI